MNAMSVPEVLRRAEQVIGERGWLVGNFEDRQTGAVCMTGALRIAAGGTIEPLLLSNEAYKLTEEARDVLWDFLGENPEDFNDGPCRMAIEVRAALLRAAKRMEEQP